ncbi:hypothetical protein Tco_1388606 [Tanacetum coccineum]
MSYDNLRELVRKLVHSHVPNLYYCKVGKTLKQGLCELKNDVDVQEFLRVGYESKWVVDLYTEHYEYDAMDYKISEGRDYESPNSSDAYCSSDDEEVIYYVDFYHGGEQNVVIKNITTNDHFLTKLYSNNGNFRGFMNEPIPDTEDLHMKDPDSTHIRHEAHDDAKKGMKPNKKTVKKKGYVTFKVNKIKTGSSKVAEPSAAEPPFRIYHKNRGRSERIFNQKIKKTDFGPNGEGSTGDKVFSL